MWTWTVIHQAQGRIPFHARYCGFTETAKFQTEWSKEIGSFV